MQNVSTFPLYFFITKLGGTDPPFSKIKTGKAIEAVDFIYSGPSEVVKQNLVNATTCGGEIQVSSYDLHTF